MIEATAHEERRVMLWRWLKFNSVGAIGVGVQLAVLTVLAGQFGLNYLVATALAVEAAVLHNFVWHEKWTWADRFETTSRRGRLQRLLQFNLTTGAVSIAGNLVFMRLFVGLLGIHFLVANLMTIATCSILNFLVSDRIVFQPSLWGDPPTPLVRRPVRRSLGEGGSLGVGGRLQRTRRPVRRSFSEGGSLVSKNSQAKAGE